MVCQYCGRPCASGTWIGSSGPYHPECTRGPDYKPETYAPIPDLNKCTEITVQVPARQFVELLDDRDRLDYLEAELTREQERIAAGKDPGVSLFRKNEPITRKAIDAVLE